MREAYDYERIDSTFGKIEHIVGFEGMIKVTEIKNKTHDFDSLVVEIPKDFAISQGLPEKSIAMLTVKNGKLESEVIPYSGADIDEVDRFLEDFPEIDTKLRDLGD